MNSENNKKYVVEDAALVVFNNISKKMQSKLDLSEIVEILEMELKYLIQSGVAAKENPIIKIDIEVPCELDENSMEYFIIHECSKEDIVLTCDELQEVLNGEFIYLEKMGLIDEEGHERFYN